MLARVKRELTESAPAHGNGRIDLLMVAEMVERGAKVLDVGCGDGELLKILGETRDVAAQHPDIVARLLKLVEEARADLGDSLTKRQGSAVRPCGTL